MPAGLTAGAASSSQINLSWSPSTDAVGVAGYRIYRDGAAIATTTSRSFQNTGLAPATTYTYRVTAYDAAGNESSPSASASATTRAASAGSVYYGNPGNYLTLLRGLKAGDTLVLEAGNYDHPSDVPGLPLFDIAGTDAQPITITGPESGPRPVLLGRSTHNTIRLANASHIVIRNLDVDGRNLGGDAVKAQGTTHHITLENLRIRGVGSDQQVVGISTNGGPTWNWVIRNNVIEGAGTGMYLGNSDGSNPFVAGVIEHNLIRDTIGYNIQIKHQNTRPSVAGMPTAKSATVIRHNVFSKSGNSAGGSLARPNLLVGHFPPSGPGADDVYEIYGNFFYQNPTEALFQGEGNIALHHNLFVSDTGSAVYIQPHNDVPKTVYVFNNTVVAKSGGISVTGGAAAYPQKVIGNAVFSGTPIQAGDKAGNVTDTYANAVNYLNAPFHPLGQLDLYPRSGALRGSAVSEAALSGFRDWDRDFNGHPQDAGLRGAYASDGVNPGWLPMLAIKPPVAGSSQ